MESLSGSVTFLSVLFVSVLMTAGPALFLGVDGGRQAG